jgi:hypothetical protein
MKYLKMFESFFGEYTEIPQMEYDNMSGKTLEVMPSRVISMLMTKLTDNGWVLHTSINTLLQPTDDLSDVCEISFTIATGKTPEEFNHYKKVVITCLNDDWYYILYIDSWHTIRTKSYYKVDQMEGLEKFIDEVL